MDASINESEDERKYVSLNVMRDGDCAAIVRICDAHGDIAVLATPAVYIFRARVGESVENSHNHAHIPLGQNGCRRNRNRRVQIDQARRGALGARR